VSFGRPPGALPPDVAKAGGQPPDPRDTFAKTNGKRALAVEQGAGGIAGGVGDAFAGEHPGQFVHAV